MFTNLLLGVTLCALIFASLFLGWLLWGRPLALARAEAAQNRTLAEAAQQKFHAAIGDLRVMQTRAERTEQLEQQLETTRQDRETLHTQLATLEAESALRQEALTAQIRQLEEMKAALTKEFQNLAQTALQANERHFLTLANESFAKHQTASDAKLAEIVSPVREQLNAYQERLKEIEKARQESYGSLTQHVTSLAHAHDEQRRQTQQLVHALKSQPKMRGRWGEIQLRNTLELAGMSAFSDFRTEVVVDDGRLRPDVVIRLPGGKSLVVDAKAPLNAYLDASEASDPIEQKAHIAAFTRAVKDHATKLGAKNYKEQFEVSPDFVILFLGGEHFISTAMEQDNDLWEYAFNKGVLIAGPTNLIAIARTVAEVWRHERLTQEARAIGELGKALYKRLQAMGAHSAALGKALEKSVSSYNSFLGSLENSVLPQARKFTGLEEDDGAQPLTAGLLIETHVRTLTPGRDLLPAALEAL